MHRRRQHEIFTAPAGTNSNVTSPKVVSAYVKQHEMVK